PTSRISESSISKTSESCGNGKNDPSDIPTKFQPLMKTAESCEFSSTDSAEVTELNLPADIRRTADN
ncbi:MAG: hypothetical protein ACXVIR_11565, partial [Halobacteriota archaeon]